MLWLYVSIASQAARKPLNHRKGMSRMAVGGVGNRRGSAFRCIW